MRPARWPEEDYTRALIAEMRASRGARRHFEGIRVSTIFFGGGTPSLFKPASIGRILDAASRPSASSAMLKSRWRPIRAPSMRRNLRGFRAAGVNRLSFGAQSFNDATLKFLGRIHNADQTREAARMAHRAGFERLNLDLIFAVPGQTRRRCSARYRGGCGARARSHLRLQPDLRGRHGVLHRDAAREDSPARKRRAGRDVCARCARNCRAAVIAMYEISNYAQPGRECRHNLTYWHNETYLGLGAGAHNFARDGGGWPAMVERADARRATSRSRRSGASRRPEAKPSSLAARWASLCF